MSNWRTACKWIVIVSLLFLAIPIRVKRPEVNNTFSLFHNYMVKYNKTYRPGSHEYDKRFKNFQDSLDRINNLNNEISGNRTPVYGLTQFSDLTEDEFVLKYLDKAKRLTKRQDKKRKWKKMLLKSGGVPINPKNLDYYLMQNLVSSDDKLPLKVDWRVKGVVSDVANQGLCGACWAYSAIQMAETMAALDTGNLTQYSVQEMIDCARSGNYGCKGGDICNLLAWLKFNNITIYTDHDYPTTKTSGECQYSKIKSSQKGLQVIDFTCESYMNNEKEILRMLSKGPVAVAINAMTWMYYLGGVIQHHCAGDVFSLNHAVLLVGYDLTADVPYYIAKNSWGKGFGIEGYLHIAIGGNVCGVALEVATVQVG